MAIRLRRVPGAGLVALCAARSVEQPGDTYLDDGAHHALSAKFALDFAAMGFLSGPPPVAQDEADAIEREESNNPARSQWDAWMAALPARPSTPAAEGESHA